MIAQRGKYCFLWIQIHSDTKHIPIKSEPAWNQSHFHYTPFRFLSSPHVFVCAVCKWNILQPKNNMPMLGDVVQWRKRLPREAVLWWNTQRGVNDALLYTSSHTARGSGRSAAVHHPRDDTFGGPLLPGHADGELGRPPRTGSWRLAGLLCEGRLLT